MITNDLRFSREDIIGRLNIKKVFIELNLKNVEKEYKKIKKLQEIFNYYPNIDSFYDFISLIINHEIIHNILLEEEPIETTHMLDNIALKYRRKGYWL